MARDDDRRARASCAGRVARALSAAALALACALPLASCGAEADTADDEGFAAETAATADDGPADAERASRAAGR